MKSSTDLPNLLIAGYHKAGTTTLFHELSRHPDIFPSIVKEPFYFRPFINGNDLPPIEEYQKNFKGAQDETYRMEASPTYIYGGARAARIIAETLGQVRIIISLRDPVDQLFSLYKHHLRFMKIEEDQSFLEFLKDKEDFQRQFFDLHLQEWYAVFGDDLKCIFFSDLIQKPEEVIRDIIQWLGLSPIAFVPEQIQNTNPGGTYKYKGAHQFALKVFRVSKRFLPHQLFVGLRKVYFKLNGQRVTHTLSDEARSFLTPVLQDHIQALRSLLISKGYTDLPAWLNEGDKST